MNYKKVSSYEAACKILKRNPKNLPNVSKMEAKYKKPTIADFKRGIIADAINFLNNNWKADHSDGNQIKYEPIFIHNGKKGKLAAFRFNYASCIWTYANTRGGSRLSFSTAEETEFFAKKHIKLHNEVLLKK